MHNLRSSKNTCYVHLRTCSLSCLWMFDIKKAEYNTKSYCWDMKKNSLLTKFQLIHQNIIAELSYFSLYSFHNLFFSIQFTLIFSILRLRYFSHRRFMWFPLFNFHTYLWKVYLKICAESWIFKYSSNLNLFFSIKGTIDRSVISSFLLIYIYYEANWWYVTNKNAFSWMQTTDMQKVCTT